MVLYLSFILFSFIINNLAANDLPSNCPPSDDGNVVLLPNAANCSQFYKCSNGAAYLYNCTVGLQFNPILKTCDWPENAGCNKSLPANWTTSVNTTTDQSPVTPVSNSTSGNAVPNCPASNDGEVLLFPNAANCSQFYKCSYGIAYLYNCSVGLHFNPDFNYCDWPENARCNKSISENETTSVHDDDDDEDEDTDQITIIPISTSTSKDDGPNCPTSNDGEDVLFPNAANCSQFYMCSYGIAYLYDCSVGLHFNPVFNYCDWPENAGCDKSISVNGETSVVDEDDDIIFTDQTTLSPPSTSTAKNEGPRCPVPDSQFPTYFPDETNCSQFYECSNGRAYLFKCPFGLYFNPRLNVCDWPETAGCNGTNIAN